MPDWMVRRRTRDGRGRETPAAVLGLAVLLAACGGGHAHEGPYRGALEVPAAEITRLAEDVVIAAPPPFSEGVFPCSRCHGDAPPPDAAEPVYPHQVHLDKGLECADCHEDDADPSPADPEMCDECHEPEARGSERATAYFALHAGGLPSRWDVNVTTAAHDRHAEHGVACADCHGGVSNMPFARPGSAVLMKRCVACHTERSAPVECVTCHEKDIRPPHENIVLHHAEGQRGCLDCHDAGNRDVLHLANGTPVPFERSYLLCGQCHGPRLRDWRLGIHGKRLGSWNGERKVLLCPHCHNPHSPRFELMKPLPPPTPPKEIR